MAFAITVAESMPTVPSLNTAINKINSNNNELINNTPETLKITEENYDEHFTEGIFNKENTLIIIDSNFTNKTLTFKNPNTLLSNPNNYTITGGKIEFTPEATGTNITNLNTKDTTITIESDNSLLENSTITSDTDKLELIINNAKGVIINNNTIIAENQEEKLAINVINSQATITNNYILTKDSVGNQAIKNTNSQITTTNNIPTPKLTDDNYNQFFNENGIYSAELVNILELGSDIYNKNMTFNTQITFTNPNKYTIYNTTITSIEKEITINNLIINNTNYPNPTIIASKIKIENNTIYQNANNTKTIILENSTTSTITYSNITTEGNNNTLLSCNNISFKSRTCAYNNLNTIGSNITVIDYNTTSGELLFGTMWRSIRSNMEYNNITIDTNTNNIPIIIYNSEMIFANNQILSNIYYDENPIIKTYNSTKTQINTNYIESTDKYGDDAINTDGRKNKNKPTTTGFKSQITNVILPEQIITNMQNNIIVNVTDSFGREITGIYIIDDGEVTVNSNTNTIPYKPTSSGEKIIEITYDDPTGKYEPISTEITITVLEAKITVDPITATAGQTINITARITADNETITDINKGKVTFKVNGKTLKDANGKVIYAKVVNGTATIENYVVPDDWAKDDTTIQAVYSGSTQCEKLTSEKTNINITPEELTLTTTATQASPGQTTTLTATLSDNTINTGKIVFKINGKTVKDANGKVIYAKVVNGTVSVDYTLPESYKAGNYTVTATFISSSYDRLEANTTMTVEN